MSRRSLRKRKEELATDQEPRLVLQERLLMDKAELRRRRDGSFELRSHALPARSRSFAAGKDRRSPRSGSFSTRERSRRFGAAPCRQGEAP